MDWGTFWMALTALWADVWADVWVDALVAVWLKLDTMLPWLGLL